MPECAEPAAITPIDPAISHIAGRGLLVASSVNVFGCQRRRLQPSGVPPTGTPVPRRLQTTSGG